MHTVFGQPEENPQAFADTWGWKNVSTDWKALVKSAGDRPGRHRHAELHARARSPSAALAAGKHVACEKPIAGTLADAREMAEAGQEGEGQDVRLVQLPPLPGRGAWPTSWSRHGKLGEIRHVRGVLPPGLGRRADVPLLWRFDKKLAGSGSHGDLNAHIIDMTRFVTGQEITEIAGADRRDVHQGADTLMAGVAAGGIAAGQKAGDGRWARSPSTTPSCSWPASPAAPSASFEAARQATGNQNRNGFEINGTKGSLKFDFERMNELEYYDATRREPSRAGPRSCAPTAATIPTPPTGGPTPTSSATSTASPTRPTTSSRVLAGKKPTVPLPDFDDAYQTQRVLEAVTLSAKNRCPVKMSQVK